MWVLLLILLGIFIAPTLTLGLVLVGYGHVLLGVVAIIVSFVTEFKDDNIID